MLLRIFDNLIGNSLKHGTWELTISVQVRKPTAPYTDTQDKDLPTDIKSSIPCSITIDFENSLTLPCPDLIRVFDEFYTTDISRTSGNTGLGLAIAKQFTEILGGKISASNVAEKFIVTVIFPQLTHSTIVWEKLYYGVIVKLLFIRYNSDICRTSCCGHVKFHLQTWHIGDTEWLHCSLLLPPVSPCTARPPMFPSRRKTFPIIWLHGK